MTMVATLLLRGELRWACLHTATHVGASLLATLAGIAAKRGIFKLVGGSA